MPNKCATLLLPAPNSEVVKISLAKVLAIIDVYSFEDKFLFAWDLAFFAFCKKYFTFFL